MTHHIDRATAPCAACGKVFPVSELFPVALTRAAVLSLIRVESPGIRDEDLICRTDLHRFRSQYLESMLQEDRGELNTLEKEVIEGLERHTILTQNLEAQFETSRSFGERIADRVATFGGSWTFIIIFFAILTGWILINSWLASGQPFDPFPFILLNLILSCLAAIQAPIIMMSQNRQDAKDRQRADHDYRVNLKAELEIRQLHSKLDQLISHQWQRLLEIQRLQIEALEELADSRPGEAESSDQPSPA
jgi:uncharacterized membrane protein